MIVRRVARHGVKWAGRVRENLPQRRPHYGEPVPKPNYHQARKQKEQARKARQQEKQQRRSTRPGIPGEEAAAAPEEETSAAPPDPSAGNGL